MSKRVTAWRDNALYKRAHGRLKKVSRAQTVDWAQSSLWATQQALDGYAATDDPAALQEAKSGVVGLLAAVDVLLDSTDN